MNLAIHDHEALQVSAQTSKTRKWLARHRWLSLFVGLPTLLAFIYYGLIASDVYVSQSRFVIKSPSQKGVPSGTLASLIQTTGFSSGKEQTQEVLEYIRSRDALQELSASVSVRDRFSGRDADLLSRFPRPFDQTTFENLYKYYRSMTAADLDAESGMAILEVRAFRPEDAYIINAKLLDLSEKLVNSLNQRAEGRAVAEAERRVQAAESRARDARLKLNAYRNNQQLIDPAKQATGAIEVSNRLVSEQAALQAQLSLMLRTVPRHPAIPSLRSRIRAIGNEIAAQNSRVVGNPGAIASKLGTYQELELEEKFAAETLTAAGVSLEQARAEAQKQQFYLERVVDPNKPDMALLPNRLKAILIVLAASLCLYFIGWMVIVGILEHAPED